MARYLRDIMTQKPVTVQTTDAVVAAARSMRDGNIGDVVVLESDQIHGILTDRDIVVRALAEGRDPARTTVGEICSGELTTLSPDDTIEDAEKLMRDRAIRRPPGRRGRAARRHRVAGRPGGREESGVHARRHQRRAAEPVVARSPRRRQAGGVTTLWRRPSPRLV